MLGNNNNNNNNNNNLQFGILPNNEAIVHESFIQIFGTAKHTFFRIFDNSKE
jgi:hypothetical protein